MTFTILSCSNRINQDVADVRVKTDDGERTLAISGEEQLQAGSLEAAVEAKLARGETLSAKYLKGLYGENPILRMLREKEAHEKAALDKRSEQLADMMAEIVSDHVIPNDSGRVVTLYENTDPTPPKTYKRIDKIGRY